VGGGGGANPLGGGGHGALAGLFFRAPTRRTADREESDVSYRRLTAEELVQARERWGLDASPC
jgi:hypothetical protein